ncbi:uncharacterized protein BT62DRAFT_472374 [Guyanagaster necrorhizus]|uniref:Uncharacterized protein n=1 Tax=Guyanagaster necrorhizus TaxID=856835 RepID=A0A9P8ANC1_9AGAR|nr:uncharacterized protein BT62DRAFT_472374 [Guyanagaster necrorhizus MCA 3950]KAG7441740.1 hypothetical protein BT62DRAFT_472374 [Guyanagaster necrorhizus MCA 3950]
MMRSNIMDQIIHSLSNHPHLRFVKISAFGIQQDIPCAPFRGLTHLTINGHGSLDYIPAIIANSPSLFRLEVVIYRYDRHSPSHFPVLSLFCSFLEGTHSSVQKVILSGDYLSLEPSTVPALIPHFRKLSNYRLPVGFDVPDEFWNALLDAMVFLHCVSSIPGLQLRDSFLNYPGAYRGLKEVHLRLGRINAQGVQDEGRARFFLRRIIPMHSWSLINILVQTEYAGCWRFDIPMLETLLLCTNLAYVGISVDRDRARVKYNDNVITKLLNNLPQWPFLEALNIGAAVPRSVRPFQPINLP